MSTGKQWEAEGEQGSPSDLPGDLSGVSLGESGREAGGDQGVIRDQQKKRDSWGRKAQVSRRDLAGVSRGSRRGFARGARGALLARPSQAGR